MVLIIAVIPETPQIIIIDMAHIIGSLVVLSIIDKKGRNILTSVVIIPNTNVMIL